MSAEADPFQPLAEFFAESPWVWAVVAVSFAAWVLSLTLVVRSPKFRRKWLWALLTLLTGSFWSWQTGPNSTVSLGLPLGAFYVIGFWLWGPKPSAEALAAEAERRAAQPTRAQIYGGRKLLVVRIAYVAAAMATATLGWTMASGAILRAMLSLTRTPPDAFLPAPVILIFQVGGAIFAGLLVALLLWIAARPQWWAKLLCLWAGFSWAMFGAMFTLMTKVMATPAPLNPTVLTVLGCGLVMLTVAVVHQIVDPRLFGWSPSPR